MIEWILVFAMACLIFVLFGLGASIWLMVLKDWEDRKKR